MYSKEVRGRITNSIITNAIVADSVVLIYRELDAFDHSQHAIWKASNVVQALSV